MAYPQYFQLGVVGCVGLSRRYIIIKDQPLLKMSQPEYNYHKLIRVPVFYRGYKICVRVWVRMNKITSALAPTSTRNLLTRVALVVFLYFISTGCRRVDCSLGSQ